MVDVAQPDASFARLFEAAVRGVPDEWDQAWRDFTEATDEDDHFHGAWYGGSKAAGGGPAGSVAERVESGAESWQEHAEKWEYNDKGEPVITKWKDARVEEVHKPWYADTIDPVPTTDEPTVYMTGGGPASGKTKGLLENKGTGIPGRTQAAHIDPDGAKAALPEYRAGLKQRVERSAAYAHEESSYMAKQGVAMALGRSKSVVYDSVGDSGADKLAKKVGQFRTQGAKRVVADYAFVSDVNTAVSRAQARAVKTGRHVAETYIRFSHADVSRTWRAAAERNVFDTLRLWNTDGPPRLVAEARGGKITVHDQKAWVTFVGLGGE